MSELTELQKISALATDLMNKKMNDTDRFVHLSHIQELVKELSESKKVVVPKFVADWLDGLKGEISDKKLSSGAAFMVFVGQQLECLYYNEYTLITDDVEGWLLHPENKVKLLNAIDNGYEVEKKQLTSDIGRLL
ncbi:DUF1642 domain-containing protein [Enterococcus faecalis]|nr:DUF1642 domain-containing protein [Enterococcus faecalis]EGO5803039.1 DUF1642 domain-containing protein [Enterococcus faecalis]EGO5828139.1 DUF1642 domain-containing protein [Enterococcus faecalis]EHA4031865.1 DUF1642 domain-containing protein [Enterococcus faecalis]HAP2800041.1 DUF1642 domain-containing protein [Enterococcus faecalis]